MSLALTDLDALPVADVPAAAAPTRPRFRLVPVPDVDPPRCDPPHPRDRPVPDRHVQLRLVPATGPSRSDGRTGADDGPTEELDDLARRMCQGVVDVMSGHRPAQQLMRWLRPEVFDKVRRRAPHPGSRPAPAVGRRPVVRSVRTYRPSIDGLEVSAVVVDGRRARALALRLDGPDGRWRVSAVVMG